MPGPLNIFLKFSDMSFEREPDVAAGYDLSMTTAFNLRLCIVSSVERSLDV